MQLHYMQSPIPQTSLQSLMYDQGRIILSIRAHPTILEKVSCSLG